MVRVTKVRHGAFFWSDTEGIPLELFLQRLPPERRVWELLMFVADAQKAGWSRVKIESDIRELQWFGIKIPHEMRTWSKQSYESDTATDPRYQSGRGIS